MEKEAPLINKEYFCQQFGNDIQANAVTAGGNVKEKTPNLAEKKPQTSTGNSKKTNSNKFFNLQKPSLETQKNKNQSNKRNSVGNIYSILAHKTAIPFNKNDQYKGGKKKDSFLALKRLLSKTEDERHEMDVRIGQFQIILKYLKRLEELFRIRRDDVEISESDESQDIGEKDSNNKGDEIGDQTENIVEECDDKIEEKKEEKIVQENEIVEPKKIIEETENTNEQENKSQKNESNNTNQNEENIEQKEEEKQPQTTENLKEQTQNESENKPQNNQNKEPKEENTNLDNSNDSKEPNPTPIIEEKTTSKPETPKTNQIESIRLRLKNPIKPPTADQEIHQLLAKLKNLGVLTMLYERQKKKRPRIVEMMRKFRHPKMPRRVAQRVKVKLRVLLEAKELMTNKSWRFNARNSFYKILDVRSSALQNTEKTFLTTKNFALSLAESEHKSMQNRKEQGDYWKKIIGCSEPEVSPERKVESETLKSEKYMYESFAKRGSVVLGDLNQDKEKESKGQGNLEDGVIAEKSVCESQEDNTHLRNLEMEKPKVEGFIFILFEFFFK